MHSSWFSYHIVRPYPFVWFTPVVFIGTVIFTVLFSVINLAANGYYLTTIYTTSPNETIAQDYWFNKALWSWGDKLKPTCQPQNIPIGFEFFTTNLGLSYTLEGVTQYHASTNETENLPSLTYLNQTLDDCQVDSVVLTLAKSDQSRNGEGAWWSWGSSNANAAVHCTLSTATGRVNATFSAQYKAGPKVFNYVISSDYKKSSSIWWGTRILNLYWAAMLKEMGWALYPNDNDPSNAANGPSTPIWMTGSMTFTPNRTTDIKAYDFFGLQYYFLAADANIYNSLADLDVMYNNIDGLTYTGPLTEGLAWAKTMYSMLLVDLGQDKLPNLLLDESLLQWILQYPDDEVRKELDPYACDRDDCDYDWINWAGIAAPNVPGSTTVPEQTPMNQSYNAFKDMMGPLGTKQTTIFSQYACSVPVKKNTGSLLIAVVIADLVFLQVLWTILNWIAGAIVVRHDAQAMSCQSHNEILSYGMVSRAMPVPDYETESQRHLAKTHDTSASGSLLENSRHR